MALQRRGIIDPIIDDVETVRVQPDTCILHTLNTPVRRIFGQRTGTEIHTIFEADDYSTFKAITFDLTFSSIEYKEVRVDCFTQLVKIPIYFIAAIAKVSDGGSLPVLDAKQWGDPGITKISQLGLVKPNEKLFDATLGIAADEPFHWCGGFENGIRNVKQQPGDSWVLAVLVFDDLENPSNFRPGDYLAVTGWVSWALYMQETRSNIRDSTDEDLD